MKLLNIKPIKAILLIILMSLMTLAECTTIQIFTDSQHPVAVDQSVMSDLSKNTISYYNLDQLTVLINQMNFSIRGNDEYESLTKLKNFMQLHQDDLRHSAEGVRLANHYHIISIPVIVFDGGVYEVQGQRDLKVGIDEYQIFLRNKKS